MTSTAHFRGREAMKDEVAPPAFSPPHPLSRRFTWGMRSGARRRLDREQVTAYDREGFFILPRAVDARALDGLTAELDPRVAAARPFYGDRKLTFVSNLVKSSQVLREWCTGELFRDLCLDLLGDDVHLYWDQAAYKNPGCISSFPWHQDNGYSYVDPQPYLTCWVALTDATPEGGCLWAFPGVHRHGTLEHRQSPLGLTCVAGEHYDRVPLDGATALSVEAGSIVVMSSLTPHATGPNRTSRTRKAYVLQFAPSNARRVQDGKQTLVAALDHAIPIVELGMPPHDV
jgi:phytanoyl-CoA hydroxylase